MTQAVTELRTSAALSTARLALAVRTATLPLSALATALAARLVIGDYGVSEYATYALVVGLVALIPFGDLGVSAALTDAAARRETLGEAQVRAVMLTSFRVLALVGVGIVGAALLGGVTGLWSLLVGLPGNATVDRSATLALIAIALSPLPMASLRLLQGAHANHVATGLQALAPGLTLVILFALARGGAPLWVLPVAPGIGFAVTGLIGLWLAQARYGFPVTATLRHLPVRSQRGGKIREFALPMLLIGLALPLAYQTDRLVLSWVATLDVVAQYSVAVPLLTAALTVIGAAGGSLWAVFAERRHEQATSWGTLTRLVGIFAAGGLLIGVGLVVVGPTVAAFVGNGEVSTPIGVFFSFAVLVLVLAAWWPLAMYLTGPADLRAQAWWHGGMVVTNIAASIPLALWLGAAGPALGSAVAVVVWLLLPGAVRARRLTHRPVPTA